MSQSLYTSMSGINAATTSINVVSNNVANINTTAFKAADTRFENLFSKTYTTGNSPTKTTGGINPMQVGLGVEVGSIVRNFTEGTYVSTGRTDDLMISGKGYFTVMDSYGQIFYTRDGAFTLDADGNMVTQNGMYVLGAAQIYNSSASQSKIHVPQTLKVTTPGNEKLGAATVDSLNDADITAGTFYLRYTDASHAISVGFEILSEDLEGSVDKLIAKLNATLAQTVYDTEGGTTHYMNEHVVAAANSNGTISFKAQPPYDRTIAKQVTIVAQDTGKAVDCYQFSVGSTDYYWSGVNGSPLYDANGIIIKNAGQYGVVSVADPTLPGVDYKITLDGGTSYTNNETDTESVNPKLSFTAGTSNFLEATRLASAEQSADGYYYSKVLDYTVKIEPVAALSEAVNLESYSVSNDGTIEATYSNGDKLTVEANNEDNTFEWKYTTSTGVVIRGADKIDMNPNIAETSGFVLQLATVTNEAGLVSKNNNLWSIGPNTGETVYAVGGSMGMGLVQTGGLEGSNVDLARELSNMIMAQRAIQANSRVFSTSSDILQTLTYLGS